MIRSAAWVWPVDFHETHNTYARFRRDFRLPRVPDAAPFYITADQCYRLFVNGRYVGRDMLGAGRSEDGGDAWQATEAARQ
jgi:hypothetical protein